MKGGTNILEVLFGLLYDMRLGESELDGRVVGVGAEDVGLADVHPVSDRGDDGVTL